MQQQGHLVVFRFSALGDVAMTVPVLRLLLQQHPQLQVYMVSNSRYAPLFAAIDRLHFVEAHLQGRHKGLRGLVQLFTELRSLGKPIAVADLHYVLRSRLLGFLFLLTGTRVAGLHKGRAQKKLLTRRYHKVLQPLPTAFERMQQVLARLGYSVTLPPVSSFPGGARTAASNATADTTATANTTAARSLTIGIAPFAQYGEKTYPETHMKALIALLLRDPTISIQLYGGGPQETAILRQWQEQFSRVQSMASTFSMQEELQHLSGLDAMISMDSANMHLASLCGVPVISIWGATHPLAGFMGWGQPDHHAVQVSLECRPCSVFGNKACYRGDLACMQQITPAAIAERLYAVLGLPAFSIFAK